MSSVIRSVLGRRGCYLVRGYGRRSLSTVTHEEEYSKRNYANNSSEYHTVISSLNAQRRYYLLKHVYDDMMLDAVQPTRDIFHSLMLGTTKSGNLDDAFFFRDEMRTMGMVPDVALYNFLISTCGRSKMVNKAIQVLEELKMSGVKPNGQTYVCLLNACAAAGKLDRVYSIVRDMTAAGAGLNKFCYAGLISAHLNSSSGLEDIGTKLVELVQQSKGWSSVETSTYPPNNVLTAISDEELYNLPTAPFVPKRGVLNRQLTVYHVAFHACVELRNVKVMEELLEMLMKDGHSPDPYILMQKMRCYLYAGNLDQGLKIFDEYMESKLPPVVEIYVALVEGSMYGYTPRGMQIALDTLVKMNSKNYFLNPKLASDLLLMASKTKVDGYTTANYLWDLAHARKLNLAFPAVDVYYNGLKEFDIPEDDDRLVQVARIHKSLKFRPGAASGRQRFAGQS